MNISCQTQPYVGRTHLTLGGLDISIIQAEIDTLNTNLTVLQAEHDYTVGFIDSNLTPLTYLINSEIETFITPIPDRIHTYIYNSNILGEIRFWVHDTYLFPSQIPLGVPDYRVKIDVDGKLKLFYTYDDAINATFGNGWIDPVNMIVGAAADSFNQGLTIGLIQGELTGLGTYTESSLQQIRALIATLAQYSTFRDMEEEIESNLNDGLMEMQYASYAYEARGTIDSAYTNTLNFLRYRNVEYFNAASTSISSYIINNPGIAFIIGTGGAAVGIAYGIMQNAQFTNIVHNQIKQQIDSNTLLSTQDRRELFEYESNVIFTSNLIRNLENNFYQNQAQGFINSNILTPQTLPNIYGSKIGLNTIATTYDLDVVGKINADYYYKSGVLFDPVLVANSCNLTRSQGFINSNVLTPQTLPNIYGSKIGLNTYATTYDLDVVGKINADYYYKSGVLFNPVSSQWISNATKIYYNSGNVGIGSSSPYGKMEIIDSVYNKPLLILDAGTYIIPLPKAIGSVMLKLGKDSYSTTTGNYYGIGFGYSPYTSKSAAEIGYFATDIAGSEKGDLVFSTRNTTSDVAATERMRITSGGNIGIGMTPNASYKLDVSGIINATNIYKNGVEIIGTQWTTSGSDIYYNSGNIGIATTPNASYKLTVNGAFNATNIYKNGVELALNSWNANGSNIYFNTGNVGIGSSIAYATLDLKGAMVIRGASDYSSWNFTYNSGGGCITIGDKGTSYGGVAGFSTNMGMMFEFLDKYEILFYKAGGTEKLISGIYYYNNLLTFGRANNYGAVKCIFDGGFETSVVSKVNAELQADTLKIKANGGAVYFNDDTSLLAVATTGQLYSTDAVDGDLVLRANTNKKLLIQVGDGQANMIMSSLNTITYNGSVYYNSILTINNGANLVGGANIPKRINLGQLTPYLSGSYYKIDIYPATHMNIGVGQIRFFKLIWYCSTANITNSNTPYGHYEIMIDYSNTTYLSKPIYVGNNTAVEFTGLSGGYISIYYTNVIGSQGIVVNIFPINVYN